MPLRGALYDGVSSRRIEATAEMAADGSVFVLVGGRRACGAPLEERGIAPEHLADLLARIEARQGGTGAGFDFLSTHPALEERAARMREELPRRDRGGARSVRR
jgi:Zn-dependent protease with chaperone function